VAILEMLETVAIMETMVEMVDMEIIQEVEKIIEHKVFLIRVPKIPQVVMITQLKM
jgi:hypothetical protein